MNTSRILFLIVLSSLLPVADALATRPAADESSPLFLPGLPELQVEHFATEAELIRDGYRRYELLAARSGAEVRFELSDFRTLYPADYDDHLMTDIRTFGGGWSLRALMKHRGDEARGLDETQFEPFWEWQRPWLEHPFSHVIGKTVAQIFTASEEDWTSPDAITTYAVHVTFDDRSRSYRAAFYFRSGGEARFTVQDHVVTDVAWVYRHLDEFELRPQEPPSGHDLERVVSPATWSSKMCAPDESVPDEFQGEADQNSDEHRDGRHSGAIIFSFSCTCSENCASRCQPSTEPKCTDFGSLSVLRAHIPHVSEADEPATSAGGDHTPASCRGAAACGVESCLDEECNSVTIGFAGSGFSFDGDTVLDVDAVHQYTCDLCTLVSEGDGDTPTGGGGGGIDPGMIDDDNPDGTPIVIDLDGRGFAFTSLDDGVLFDIDVDRRKEQVAWTAPGGSDAFLAIDLNQNGQIDDGYELFGDRSFHTHDQEPNGYLALAEYDRADMGGNEDGWISAEDADWQFLRLWLDENGNGRTEPHELSTLEAWNVAGIELAYTEARRQDRHGNWLRYRSKVRLAHPGGRPHTFATDVYLLTREVAPQ